MSRNVPRETEGLELVIASQLCYLREQDVYQQPSYTESIIVVVGRTQLLYTADILSPDRFEEIL